MSHSVKITTPIPSPEDVASSLGVSRARLAELRALVEKQAFVADHLPTRKALAKRVPKNAAATRRAAQKRG